MKKNLSGLTFLIIFALLGVLSTQYALEGNWRLINNNDIKLDPSVKVEFQFVASVGPNNTITRTLLVHACYELSYSYQVSDNSIYINFQSILSLPRKCVGNQISTVRSKIETVFYFVINGTTLSLFDPTGFAPFVFQNYDASIGPAINGGWQTLTVNQDNQYENIYLNGSHAFLCGGNGIAIYNVTSKSQIIFTIMRSRGCSSDQIAVLSALDNAIFYRVLNETYLYLYDYRLNNIMYAYYTSFVGYAQNLKTLMDNINNAINPPAKSTQNSSNQTNNNPSQHVPPPSPSIQPQAPTPKPNNYQSVPLPQKEINSSNASPSNGTGQDSNAKNASSPPKQQQNISLSQNITKNTSSNQNPSSTQNQTISPSTNTTQPTTPPAQPSQSVQNSSQPTDNSNSQKATNDSKGVTVINNAVPPALPNITVVPPISPPAQSNFSSLKSTPPPAPAQVPPPSPPAATDTSNKSPTYANVNLNQAVVTLTPALIASAADLTPFTTKLLDGKWYINNIGPQGSSNYKNFYFIVNSSARRFIIYGGCNVQFFIYTLANNNQISFGTPTGTTKVCTPNNDFTVTDPIFKNSVYIQATTTTLTFYDAQFNPTVMLVNSSPL